MKMPLPVGFRLVNPEMFINFAEVSFHKSPTKISNDMTKKIIFTAALLLAGGAPDKCRVNFPGFGLKVILSAFLTLEE